MYLLLSDDKVYVGQSSDLAKRVKQHLNGKNWWDRVLILTKSDDSLNRADIDYLEYFLIKKANESNRLDSDNKSRGNIPKVDKFRKPELEQYLEEALFLMELIGVNVFSSKGKKRVSKNKGIEKKPITGHAIISTKEQAKEFFLQNGVLLGDNFNYASLQKSREEFWINPKKEVILKDWELILNNQFSGELIYIRVPANTFSISKSIGDNGLRLRNDKPYIDLHINEKTFIERKSKCDFSQFVLKKFRYK